LANGGFHVERKELMQELEKDRLYYDQSGGGVTFTGGDPSCKLISCSML